MSSRIHLVTGDTSPTVYIQLLQPDGLLDVSLAQVFLRFKAVGSDAVLFQLTGELLPGTLQEGLIKADLSQYPTPGSGGRVKFGFIQGNLNLPPGRYVGEIEVSYGPDNTFTVFTRLLFILREEFDG